MESIGKILFISYSLCNGGAERVLSELANQLVTKDIEVTVLLYHRFSLEYYLCPDVKIIEMGNDADRGKISLQRSLNRIRTIRKVIKEEKPDYIVPFLDSIVRESRIAAIGLNTHVIATVRNNPYQVPYSKFMRLLRNIVCRICSAVYVQNNKQKDYFSKRVQRKTFVLPNPVSNEMLATTKIWSGNIRDFVTCGRLHEQKNHKLMIEAFDKVVKSYSDAKLYIYGAGELESELKAYIQDKHLSKSVYCMGRTENVRDVLLNNDCFLLSSDYEGMPNALMEAMGVGLPCISTDCPTGPSDLIINMETGILVPVGDAEEMAKSMLYLIENPEIAKNLGQKAKAFVQEHYSEEYIAEMLMIKLKEIAK